MQVRHDQNEKYSSVNVIIVLICSLEILTIQHWHHSHQNQVRSLPCGGLRGGWGEENVFRGRRGPWGAGRRPGGPSRKGAGAGRGRARGALAASARLICMRTRLWGWPWGPLWGPLWGRLRGRLRGRACYRRRPPAPHPGVPSCLSALTGLSRGCLGKGGQRSTPRTRQPGPPFGRQPSLWRTGALGVGPRGICRAAISRASPSRSTRAGPRSSLCSAPHLLRPPS